MLLAVSGCTAQSAHFVADVQNSQLSTEQSRKDDERNLSRLYSQCVNAAGGSDINMQDCTNEERNRWDQRLNKAYSAILNRNRDKIGMRNQERSWIKERDAKCINNDPQRGTLDALNEENCMLIETVDRTLILEMVLRAR